MAMGLTMKKKVPKALEAWDPFAQMRADMARLWNEPWGALMGTRAGTAGEQVWAPRVDMFDRGNKLVVKADLPGINKDGVEVSLENGDLLIRAERREEKETEAEEYYRMERTTGSFFRRLALPFEVEPRAINARFTDGVLEVEIERPAEAKVQAQKIAVR
jgi:HSP20 family protein